jgi:hypothetical protein
MKTLARTTVSLAVASSLLVAGCAAPGAGRGPSPAHGIETFGEGLAHLMLSPFMIIAGLMEGIAALPYFLGEGVHEINRGLRDANASVSLDETYRYAYDEPLEKVPDDGDTGKVFRDMDEATDHFQKVLRGYGVEDHRRYLLTAIRSADRVGFTLYAVVYRPSETVRVRDKVQPERVLNLGPQDRAYYQPYVEDAEGRPLDLVIDWAGVPRTSIRTQKGQAILMTLAANSVLVNRRSDEYWAIEQTWIDGGYRDVVAGRKEYLDDRMGLGS